MSLTLYYHPLASFCHKVLVALYENETPFEGRIVDLADERSSAEMLSYWPVGKFPVLRDEKRGRTVPETSIIIEYLSRHYPGRTALVPDDPELALEARLWDRFFDFYVNTPMGKVVTDRLPGRNDPFGVDEARATLRRAYDMLERQVESRQWAVGDEFTMADCAAAPSLFYAGIVEPFGANHPRVAAYFERLYARPSFARTIAEARPYFVNFPYHEAMPARFLSD
jgi:glutathione S-transferase